MCAVDFSPLFTTLDTKFARELMYHGGARAAVGVFTVYCLLSRLWYVVGR